MKKKIKVLFVCMGNICRSPTAHGVFEKLVDEKGLSHLIEVDSAGTHAYHIGSPPDKRSQKVAMSHGLDLSYISGRQVTPEDFKTFDYILAMDKDNYNILSGLCDEDNSCSKLFMFLSFAPELKPMIEVPDPYFGGERGFDNVYEMVVKASEGLLNEIKSKL